MGKFRRTMQTTQEAPYPYNLIRDVFGEYMPPEKLAPDMDRSLEHIMSTLPERDAAIVQLRYKDDQAIREIAAQYGVTRDYIHQLIQRNLRRLRHPSRARYFVHGYEATTKKEEQKQIRAQRREEQILSFLQPDKFAGSLLEITDARDRADAILARCGLDYIYKIGVPTCVYSSLYRTGIEYIWQLCFLQPDELLKLCDIGPKRATAIERYLSEQQLALDDGTLSAAPELWDYLAQRSEELARIIQETSQWTA